METGVAHNEGQNCHSITSAFSVELSFKADKRLHLARARENEQRCKKRHKNIFLFLVVNPLHFSFAWNVEKFIWKMNVWRHMKELHMEGETYFPGGVDSHLSLLNVNANLKIDWVRISDKIRFESMLSNHRMWELGSNNQHRRGSITLNRWKEGVGQVVGFQYLFQQLSRGNLWYFDPSQNCFITSGYLWATLTKLVSYCISRNKN